MSGDDELERLLREVDSTLSGSPARTPASSPARTEAAAPAPRGRVATALRTGVIAGVVSGVVVGGATFLFAWLPVIDNPISSGLGAFVGAFGTGAVLTATRRRG